MSKRHLSKSIVFFFFLLLPSLNLSAITTLTVERSNIGQRASEIAERYGPLTGIDFLTIYDYLYRQLNLVSGFDEQLQEPDAEIITSTEQGLIFRWDTVLTTQSYGVGFLDLNDKVTEESFIADPGVQICRLRYLYHLFSFATIKEDNQSKLYIIIIDRDAFLSCEDGTTFHSLASVSDPVIDLPPQPRQQFIAQPSLTHNSTELQFDLPESGTNNLFIYELRSGRLIARPLDNAWLDQGQHRIPLDMSNWPSGLYVCTLQSGTQSRAVKLVKL